MFKLGVVAEVLYNSKCLFVRFSFWRFDISENKSIREKFMFDGFLGQLSVDNFDGYGRENLLI